MSLFRIGLLLLPLLLSACSGPVFHTGLGETAQETTSDNSDILIPNTNTNTNTKQANLPSASTKVSSKLLEQLKEEDKLAHKQHNELNIRIGSAPQIPTLTQEDKDSATALKKAIQTLQDYNQQLANALSTLNTRVLERQQSDTTDDKVQIFLSNTNVTQNGAQFTAQPVVGQWVRGESRSVRLKDTILFETQQSEELKITYSENYQLIINDQVIGTINPQREKNSSSFKIQDKQKNTVVTGQIDYRIVKQG